MTPPKPLIVAHRGASAGLPDNSVEAYEAAITLGADMIEFDVRRTRHGELIAFHDADVAGASIGALTRAEIGARTGREPPLLTDVLEIARGRIGLDIELKEDGYIAELLPLLRDGLIGGEWVVTSFIDAVVAQVKAGCPQGRAGLLLGLERPIPLIQGRRSELDPVGRAHRCNADFVAPHVALARLGTLANAARAGLPAFVWTVNDDRGIRRLLGDSRVEAVITDVPGRAIELRRAHGLL